MTALGEVNPVESEDRWAMNQKVKAAESVEGEKIHLHPDPASGGSTTFTI